MAQKTIVEAVDDLDGSPADYDNVPFGLDGVTFEIDLSEENYRRLKDGLHEFVMKARRVGGRTRVRSAGRQVTSSVDNAAKIREWALATGYELSDRGRIPNHIVDAYNEARAAEEKPAKAPAKAASRRTRTKKAD
jgi:hypothetical protein